MLQGLRVRADIGGLQLNFRGTMFGNCATGSVAMVTTPTITIRMAITIATMGRLMKKFDMDPASFRSNSAGCALASSGE